MTKEHDPEEMKRQKAVAAMYKHGCNPVFNLEMIEDDVNDMYDKCSDITWYTENEDDTLLADMLGDDEQAYEFRAAFGDLSAECEMMYDMLHNYGDKDVREHFNDFFCAAAHDDGLWGYNDYDCDYYDLDTYMTEWAVQESTKRLLRFTKERLIELAQKCFRIVTVYLGLKHRFEGLDAVYDILHENNLGLIETLKNIDEAYEKAEAEHFRNYTLNDKFERLTETLPEEMWVM